MSIEVQIPTLGESVTEGVIVRWIKREGDTVAADEPLFELETVLKPEGTTVQVGEVVARIEDGVGAAASAKAAPAAAKHSEPAPAAPPPPPAPAAPESSAPLSPAVRRLVDDHGLDPNGIAATGKGGREDC